MKKFLKGLLIFILILIILACVLIGAGYYFIKSKISKTYIDVKPEEIEVNEGVTEQLTGYRNIALLGIDSRKDDYGTGNRSDCIIIASINNDTKEVRLASVYRDSYLKIKGSLDKVTHAYSYGGAALTLSTLNTNLDLDITEFVTVNFDAVAELVDSVGGVEIEIEPNEIKHINNYIIDVSKHTGKKSERITTPGKKTLNGVQAVAYSRIRYTEGWDYKRTERMREVLAAMLEKVKTKSVIKEVSAEFEKWTGRKYDFFEKYKLDDAEIAIVCMNSTAGTTKAVVDSLREKGVKAGLLKVRKDYIEYLCNKNIQKKGRS